MNYSIEFRTIAAENNWNTSFLFDAFYNDHIKDMLAVQDLLASLDALVALGIHIDSHLLEQRREREPCQLPRKRRLTNTSIFQGPLLGQSLVPLATLQSPCSSVGPDSPWQNNSAACRRTIACTVAKAAILSHPIQ